MVSKTANDCLLFFSYFYWLPSFIRKSASWAKRPFLTSKQSLAHSRRSRNILLNKLMTLRKMTGLKNAKWSFTSHILSKYKLALKKKLLFYLGGQNPQGAAKGKTHGGTGTRKEPLSCRGQWLLWGFRNEKVRGGKKEVMGERDLHVARARAGDGSWEETKCHWVGRGKGSILETARDGLTYGTKGCFTPSWLEIRIFYLLNKLIFKEP